MSFFDEMPIAHDKGNEIGLNCFFRTFDLLPVLLTFVRQEIWGIRHKNAAID